MNDDQLERLLSELRGIGIALWLTYVMLGVGVITLLVISMK